MDSGLKEHRNDDLSSNHLKHKDVPKLAVIERKGSELSTELIEWLKALALYSVICVQTRSGRP